MRREKNSKEKDSRANDIFTCPECKHEFYESEAQVIVRNMNFNRSDDAIQATSLVYCPECTNVVLAIFDSMTCSSLL